MTEQTNVPTDCARMATPVQDPTGFGIPIALDRLIVAAQAARLAIDTISEAERTSRAAQLAAADLTRNWRSANLLVEAAFDALYNEVLHFERFMQSR
jgi:hypothetical protein